MLLVIHVGRGRWHIVCQNEKPPVGNNLKINSKRKQAQIDETIENNSVSY